MIGLLGGMSWESSADYYRLLNEAVKNRLGGLHSASCLLLSVDFAEIETLQRTGEWDEAGRRLAAAARSLERGGADFIVLCTNTMHEVAQVIVDAVRIPLLHIADPTATSIVDQGLHTVGLLGTRYTMERDFYRSRLADRGLVTVIPDEPDRTVVHEVIYNELVLGRVEDRSRRAYLDIIDRLVGRGAEGIILGCTEIGMLIKSTDLSVPTFDTTRLHAEHAVELALAGATGARSDGGD